MEFIKRFKDRAPVFDLNHEELIRKFTVTQGGRAGTASTSTTWEQGKYFHNQYEIFMYATILGLKKDYSLPIPAGSPTKDFIEIRSWQPYDLADYIIMCILTKSDIDFNDLEDMEEKEVEKEITNLKKLMEEYANGGFDKIRAKYESDPAFFESNDNCFFRFIG